MPSSSAPTRNSVSVDRGVTGKSGLATLRRSGFQASVGADAPVRNRRRRPVGITLLQLFSQTLRVADFFDRCCHERRERRIGNRGCAPMHRMHPVARMEQEGFHEASVRWREPLLYRRGTRRTGGRCLIRDERIVPWTVGLVLVCCRSPTALPYKSSIRNASAL